ncbi:MAG: RIP metalloprotease RseP [Candidatus Omnitrophica bacterium]|nr:RIP metalloprotease RseP [Candidatus Omnitrophota bacterium]
MSSLLAFIFVFGILIFIHEFGHFIFAKKNGVRVDKFSFGFGPKLWSKKVGETEYLISAVPLGGYIKMAGDEPGEDVQGKPWEFLSKTCGQRAQIISAGPVLNYVLAFVLFSFVFMIGAPTMTNKVGELIDGYPAKAAGIKKGDVILSIDGEKVEYWNDIVNVIRASEGKEIVMDIQRNNRVLQKRVSPQVEEIEDILGQKTSINLIGIRPSEEMTEVRYGFFRSFYEGGNKLLDLTAVTYKALWYVAIRRLSFKESFSGPIGIFYFTGKAAELGFVYLLNLMALFSMSLAIFNFLPVPVLDGGHLFFLFLEKLRKRPVSAKVQNVATQMGITALVILMLFASYNDMRRSGWIEKVQGVWSEKSEDHD